MSYSLHEYPQVHGQISMFPPTNIVDVDNELSWSVSSSTAVDPLFTLLCQHRYNLLNLVRTVHDTCCLTLCHAMHCMVCADADACR